MGMYDSVYVDVGLPCAAGHRSHDFQTKDIGNHLDHYYVFDGVLYVFCSRVTSNRVDDGEAKPFSKVARLDDDRIELWAPPTVVTRSHLSERFEVHAICRRCEPVWTVDGNSVGFGVLNLNDHQPWIAWTLTFDNGKLVEQAPEQEGRGWESTREAIRKHLVEQGSFVLADGDPRIEKFKRRFEE